MTYSIQKLFVTILVFCNPVGPLKLWLDHSIKISFEYMYLIEDEAFDLKSMSCYLSMANIYHITNY